MLRLVPDRPIFADTGAIVHLNPITTIIIAGTLIRSSTSLTQHLLRPIYRVPLGYAAEEAKDGNCWPQTEFTAGNEPQVFGLFSDFGLNGDAEAAIASYLKKSTDTETPRKPRAYWASKQ